MKQVILKGKVLLLIFIDIPTLILTVFLCPKQDELLFETFDSLKIKLETLGLK